MDSGGEREGAGERDGRRREARGGASGERYGTAKAEYGTAKAETTPLERATDAEAQRGWTGGGGSKSGISHVASVAFNEGVLIFVAKAFSIFKTHNSNLLKVVFIIAILD